MANQPAKPQEKQVIAMGEDECSFVDAVRAVYDWQYPDVTRISGPSFFEVIIYAIRKADRKNKKRLESAFPVMCAAVRAWDEAGDNGNDLFRKYKIGHFSEA